MAETHEHEVPQTLEGWYVLHDIYAVDWPAWRGMEPPQRDQIGGELAEWMSAAAGCAKGDSAAYSILTQKGDLMFLHYRENAEELNRLELSLRQTRFFEFLVPMFSYLSVIELGLYELTVIVRKRLADQGVHPGSDEYEQYFDTEMNKQRKRVESRLFRRIPEHLYICFYPMSKRRGEQVNWYTLTMEERRELMRSHGHIGHKYHEQVTQVVGGSIGLDDWEWGVSLHAADVLAFKKLIHEMRFDPASARYAEFGPFYVGIRVPPARLCALLEGELKTGG